MARLENCLFDCLHPFISFEPAPKSYLEIYSFEVKSYLWTSQPYQAFCQSFIQLQKVLERSDITNKGTNEVHLKNSEFEDSQIEDWLEQKVNLRVAILPVPLLKKDFRDHFRSL